VSALGFTRGLPFTVEEDDLTLAWRGGVFLCGMCMRPFAVGDTARWIYSGFRNAPNTFVCTGCDGPDVLDRWTDRWRNVITPILRRWGS